VNDYVDSRGSVTAVIDHVIDFCAALPDNITGTVSILTLMMCDSVRTYCTYVRIGYFFSSLRAADDRVPRLRMYFYNVHFDSVRSDCYRSASPRHVWMPPAFSLMYGLVYEPRIKSLYVISIRSRVLLCYIWLSKLLPKPIYASHRVHDLHDHPMPSAPWRGPRRHRDYDMGKVILMHALVCSAGDPWTVF
jgi:hypothetical protein